LHGARLRVTESPMAVTEGIVEGRPGASPIRGAIASRLVTILICAILSPPGLTPTVAKPGEQVVGIDVLGRYREHEAVRPTPESDLAEQTGHMRELAAVESS